MRNIVPDTPHGGVFDCEKGRETMNHQDFKAQYNERLSAMKADKHAILGVVSKDGDAVVFNTKTPGISILFYDKEKACGAMVSCKMSIITASAALVNYACAVDVFMGVTEARRNKWLERLHLFDGKLTHKGSNLTVGKHTMEVMVGKPSAGMMTLSIFEAKE